MTVPNPRAYDAQIRQLEKEIRALLTAALRTREPLRWAYYAGLQTSVRSDDKQTGGRSRPVHELNPTLGVVTDAQKRALRAACHDAMRHLVASTKDVREWTNVINGIRERLSLSFGDNPTPAELAGSEPGVLLPRTVKQEELRESEDNARRRRLAGEGYGEA